MDRREFGTLLPALLAFGTVGAAEAKGQEKTAGLPVIESGVYRPGDPHGSVPERMSRGYLTGLLKAGNVRLEMHETTQEVGAPHEAVGTHLHNELWLVREGTVELTTNGVARRMIAGDVGICVAGDKHFVANVGDTKATYFVVTVGPIEPA
jgi:mannose-6-phosphate isomerase-like protein (cupin superfamily)